MAPHPQNTPPGTVDTRAWAGLCAALAAASGAVWKADQADVWVWNAQAGPTQAWRLWTAALAPDSGTALAAAVIALLVLAVLGAWLGAGGRAVASVLLAWPLGTEALALWPAITTHGGLSGLACSMWAVLGVHATRQGGTRHIGAVLMVMLAAKLLTDQAWLRPIGYDPDWGENLHYAAHLSGALAGTVCALVLRAGATAKR